MTVATAKTTRAATRRAVIAWIGIAALLAGCGFELRGSQVLDTGVRHIFVSGPILLRNEIKIYLEGADTTVLRTAQGADVVLTLGEERYDRRVLSVNPDTGKEREFELSYSVPLNARGKDGRAILPQQTLTLVRDYVFDSDAIIGASREEAVLREEMRRDAAQQILFRLRSASPGKSA